MKRQTRSSIADRISVGIDWSVFGSVESEKIWKTENRGTKEVWEFGVSKEMS